MTGMFYVPGGNSTQHQGVAGDIILPSALNNDKIGEKTLDNSMPPQKISPFLGENSNYADSTQRWTPVKAEEIKVLAQKSKERVEKDPKFLEIKKEIAEADKNDGLIKLAELQEKIKADKKKIKEAENKTIAERVKEADAPIINEAINVLVDLIQLRSSNLEKSVVVTNTNPDSAPAKKN